MDRNAERRPSEPGRPLSIRAIVIGGALMGVVGAAAVFALLHFYGGGTPQDQVGLDMVRTAGTLVVGTGGAIALLLAARRQRSTELTLEHQREVAAITARDAVEQRITELYTRAVDQLGNDQAPVRLGGLHALERLSQNNPMQRQTVVDVICAYLRMPYFPPDENPPGDDVPAEAPSRYEQRRQELQVRLTAQRILAAHLKPDAEDNFWPDIDLDLSEAQLNKFDLVECQIRNANFIGAQFSGLARFDGAQFSGVADFNDARFSGVADFNKAQFSGVARFDEAQFSGVARFDEAQFSGVARFDEAQFSGLARFDDAQFSGEARFEKAQFSGDATFLWTQFYRRARFDLAHFFANAWFSEAQFSRSARFDRTQFACEARFEEAQFSGEARFEKAQFSGEARFGMARARPAEDSIRVWPANWTTCEAHEDQEEGWLYLVSVEGLD